MNIKISSNISIAIAVISIMVVVTASPIILNQVFAAKTTTTTCSGPNGDTSGSCPGNSGNNGNTNKCQTTITKAGQGNGKGEIKGSSTAC